MNPPIVDPACSTSASSPATPPAAAPCTTWTSYVASTVTGTYGAPTSAPGAQAGISPARNAAPADGWLVLVDGGQHHHVTWRRGRDLLLQRLGSLSTHQCHRCASRFDAAFDIVRDLTPGTGFMDMIDDREFILVKEHHT